MICNFCGSNKAKGDENYVYCPACGIGTYNPTQRADLYKRRPVPLINRLISAVLFKLYFFSVRLSKKLEGEVRKPRMGAL